MSQTPDNAPLLGGKLFLGPIASVQEAMDWAQSVGVIQADYGGNLRVARIVTAALKDIRPTNLPSPSVVQVNREAFLEQFGQKAAVIPAGSVGSILLLNPDAPYWDAPEVAAEAAEAARFWSTDNPLHAIYHEAGHFSHYKNSGNALLKVASLI